MKSEISLSEYKLSFRKIAIKEQRIGFLIHSFFYVVTNSGLIYFNLSSKSQYSWYYWPLLCWGFGLAMHFLFGVLLFKKAIMKKEELAEKNITEQKKI
jgi:phosphotransferase system  glucose/maltose/N-acetylglucosamine-specific IIC component